MIRIRRIGPPHILKEKGKYETEKAAKFYKDKANRLKKFNFTVYRHPDVKDTLVDMFNGKCAYCESYIGHISFVDIDQFRPKMSAINLDGTITKPGYWWLANEWSNLYLSCPQCNRTKMNRFPVIGERAEFGTDITKEKALLIDPCRDDPDEYLVFNRDGYVASIPPDSRMKELFEGHDRGATSIDIYGLNRRELVNRRIEVIKKTQPILEEISDLIKQNAKLDDFEGQLRILIEPTQEYAALKRQLIGEWLKEQNELETLGGMGARTVEEEIKERAFEKQEQKIEKRKAFSVEQEEAYSEMYVHTSNLSRIEIENFRCIKKLDFNFGSGGYDKAGWKVLLGENAVGKSSVLHAVALTLMGNKYISELPDIDPTKLLRRGETSGCVRLFFSADSEPLEMYLKPEGIEFNNAQAGLRTILLGFGSARWLPKPGSLEPEKGTFIRIRNLFNPFVPLIDAHAWLLKLTDEMFEQAEEVLLRILDLVQDTKIEKYEGKIVIQPPGVPLDQADSISDLSDGYQTILAMAVHIMETMSSRWDDMDSAEGMVLLDEIGAHLHPRWKMKVLSSLRNAFPNVQFLATTHEPLCLRGLFDGEILVMRKRDNELMVIDDIPSPDTMRVDQLLTSHLFGLNSTLGPEIEDQFTKYYDLLIKPQNMLTEDDQNRLKELREGVGSKGLIGNTVRDHLIYQLADEFLAVSKREGTELVPEELNDELKDDVAKIWQKVRGE